MTGTSTPSASRVAPDTAGRRIAAPAVLGVAYAVIWIVGLSVFPVDLPLDAPASTIVRAYVENAIPGTVQYLLAEGVAGVLLGAVLLAFARTRRDDGMRLPSLAATAGVIAVAISLAQCAVGLTMIALAPRGVDGPAPALFDLVNGADGVKMLALALVAASLALAPSDALPVLLRVLGAALALALVASAIPYLLLWGALQGAAYVSGPLLLLWVAGLGIRTTLVRRRRVSASPPASR